MPDAPESTSSFALEGELNRRDERAGDERRELDSSPAPAWQSAPRAMNSLSHPAPPITPERYAKNVGGRHEPPATALQESQRDGP
jgi:hypothetical protein